MYRTHRIARTVVGASLALVIASCSNGENQEVLGPELTGTRSIFQNYVAIGNSITAGYQSSGINNAGQLAAYPNLLAQQMGTRYAYPALASVGCPPPVTNFQTQARPTGTTAATCALRDSTVATRSRFLNNVAVPGAASADPTSESTTASNILTSLFLGGQTQVEKALDADPTFVSIWIGNNDVLGPAVSDGRTATITAGLTSTTQFQTNYTAMLDQLTAGAPGLEGVLIGVVNVTSAPIMFPALALQNAAFKAGFDQLAGTVTTVDASCLPGAAGANSVINTFMAFQIRTVGAAGGFPPIIACVPGGASGLVPAPVGDILVLDPTEQATIAARVTAYNAHISAKATELGWAYYDPNPTLVTLRTANVLIRQVPTLGTTNTFGTGMSLDGVHPAAGVQREIANALIGVINTHYNTTLSLVP
jgi:lysophospholipase L1-like esterase